jgi:predicted naringenin-chalcone synthase
MDNIKSMSVKIKTVSKALPAYTRTTSEIIPFIEGWLAGQDDRFIRKVRKIFESAAVDQRYSIMSPQDVFSKLSFEERNQIYVREIPKLGATCLKKALEKANWQPKDLD